MRARSRVRRAACLTAALAGLMLAAPATAPAAVTCDFSSNVLTVTMSASSDIAGLSVSSGNIVVKNSVGAATACTGATPTTTTTSAISVANDVAHPSFDSVVIEDAGSYVPGTPSQDASDPPGSTPEIEIFVNLHGGEGSHLSVRGGNGDSIRFGQEGINPNATAGEVTPDADIFPLTDMTLEGRVGTSAAAITGTLGAQGGAGTGAALSQPIELIGNNGVDNLTGGDGNDRIESFLGADTIAGGPGDDSLQPGADDDSVDGNEGRDTLDYADFVAPSIAVDLAASGPQNTRGSGLDTIANVENVLGTPGSDVLRGNGAANELTGGNGNDNLEGRGGKDTLDAGAGDDTVDARDGGPDSVDCGADLDSVIADMLGVDSLTGCENADFVPTPATNGGGGGGAAAPLLVFGKKTHVSLKLAAGRIPSKGPLKIRVANANGFTVTGLLSGQTTKKVTVSRKRRVKLKTKSFRVGAHAKRTVSLKLPKALRTLLRRNGRLALALTARVTDPAKHTRTVRATARPKLKRAKQH